MNFYSSSYSNSSIQYKRFYSNSSLIPPPRGLGLENKFWDSLESTDERLSGEHWQGLMIFKSI